MDYIVYIIIAVIIVAAIAVLLMRGSKNKTASQVTPTEQPKPITQERSEPVPTAPPEPDYVLNAQDYINQQRYDDAINELQGGLKKKPNDNAITLKLLNVYALTNQRDDFDTLYTKLESFADSATRQQAQDLKNMLDEESNLQKAQAEPVAAVDTAPSTDSVSDAGMTFDFDDGSEETATSAPATNEVNASADAELTFDDLESQLFEDTNQQEDTFELNELDAETQTKTEPLDLDSDIEPTLDFESAVDFESEISNDQPVTTETIIQPDIDSIEEDFDFAEVDLEGANDETTADNTPLEEVVTEESADLEIDLATDDAFVLETKENPVVELAVESSEDEAELTWDTVDEPTELEAETIDLSPDDTSTEATVAAETSFDAQDDTYAQLDALTQDEVLGADLETEVADTEAKVDDETVVDEATDSVTLTGQPTVEIETVDSPEVSEDQSGITAPVVDDNEFMQAFDFVEELDSSQVTLDLAQQYLQLGEYDSAKRLVNEVLEGDSTDEQKSSAQDILARMN